MGGRALLPLPAGDGSVSSAALKVVQYCKFPFKDGRRKQGAGEPGPLNFEI